MKTGYLRLLLGDRDRKFEESNEESQRRKLQRTWKRVEK